MKGKANQEGLKLNGTHQIPVYGDDVNILAGTKHRSCSIQLQGDWSQVNAEKTKYVTMSRE
jgi:hypothetical protein